MKSEDAIVVGIDVGDVNKGFHLAICQPSVDRITDLYHACDVQAAVDFLRQQKSVPRCIGIDAPAKSLIKGPETRAAERVLAKLGYRPQWTRRHHQPPGWMVQGEKLWTALKASFPTARLIETFPTASVNGLNHSSISLNLNTLHGRDKRKYYKDFLDACICAVVVCHVLDGTALELGPEDELNPIYVLPDSSR